jgi:tRNA dimethylallyltransferase
VYAYIIMKNQLIDRPFMLVIYGPTGVGKTDMACAIAATIPAEIINMDMGQFYTPLSIGTAKPDWKNSTIPHHLLDIIDSPDNDTVSEYRT